MALLKAEINGLCFLSGFESGNGLLSNYARKIT